MSANARQYREHLYRLRSHPHAVPQDDFYDRRDSFAGLYFSLVPFLALEYVAEASYEYLPSGLVFPTSFLLFWAFFYTFYKPGFLEDRLSSPQKWDLIGIPTVLLGVIIWFVKITVVELGTFFLRAFISGRRPVQEDRRKRPRSGAQSPPPRDRAHSHQRSQQQHRAPHAEGTRFHQAPPRPQAAALPRDILHALHTLGLQEGVDWNQIHRRYRELAKQYHPDLNKEITAVGRRFMMYDAAYRKLASVKVRYFPEKRSHG